MYNIAGVSKTPGTSPLNSASLPNCPDKDPCSWTCSNGCLGPDDITSCLAYNNLGLTYDDGPTAYTPQVLDMLTNYKLKATFFVIGAQVVRFPETLKRAYDLGHQIGIFIYSIPPNPT